MSSSAQPTEYALKETSPFLGVSLSDILLDEPDSTCDLVGQMQFLFVRVVKAHNLTSMDITGSLDPYLVVKVGNCKVTTRHMKKHIPEWNEVFAFAMDGIQASVLKVVIKNKGLIKDEFVGTVKFDIDDVAIQVPPCSSLAPEWYWLKDKKGEKVKSELLVAVWIGTQADEAFPDAWHADASTPIDRPAAASTIRSKVYHAPPLWYVRVNIIEAKGLIPTENREVHNVRVIAQIGNQVVGTRIIQSTSVDPIWDEDLLFVTAEPFEDHLILTVEDIFGHDRDEIIGRVTIPLSQVEKRTDDRSIHTHWFNIEKPVAIEDDQLSRLHLGVSLEGGYHVLDESIYYKSDLRPSAQQLWKPPIGELELGILNAELLEPVKTREGKGTSDTYCVAKYNHKWIRTRTIINSLSPKYHEKYTWEVFDPATVLTIGVFDNSQVGEAGNSRDMKIGKVRIRISTLETGRVSTHYYPLLVLLPSGVRKIGELQLAIRFSSTSLVNMFCTYSRPLLPKMHYIRPLTVVQLELLRDKAVDIVAAHLSQAEPPLCKEVIEYVSDLDSHFWSMRRSIANLSRLKSVFSALLTIRDWFGDVCKWKNPVITVLVHIIFLILVYFREYLMPLVSLCMFLLGVWKFQYRRCYPQHMISYAEFVHPDELEEEFDTFPTSCSPDLLQQRYDRLRSLQGRLQALLGDLATNGERLHALLSWQDQRASAIFVSLCMIATIILFVTPCDVVVAIAGLFSMWHTRFRHWSPMLVNFVRRLPSKTDYLL